MFRSLILEILYRFIFPRGRKFIPKPHLENGWSNHELLIKGKKLYFISKISPHLNGKNVAVLLAHPYLTEGRYHFIRSGVADVYDKLGADIYITDFNGFGSSPFRDFEFELDLQEVGEYIKNADKYDRIILHGISFGAAQSIVACCKPHHSFTHLVVENCLDENISYFKVRNRLVYHVMKIIHFFKKDYAEKHRYYERMNSLNHIDKVVLIYGDQDALTTVEMGNLIFNNCKVDKEMFVLKAKHLDSVKTDHLKYQAVLASIVNSES